jgi:hypothetical protein
MRKRSTKTLASVCVAALAMQVASCGAMDQVAPPPPPSGDCAPAQEQLSTLLRLLDEGRLSGLRQATQQDFTDDARRLLIRMLLDIVGALPEGTLPGLVPLLDQDLDPLVNELVLVMKTASDYQALGRAGELIERCTGKPLLITLAAALADPAWRAALADLLGGEGLPIDLAALQSRTGFQALLRALLTSISDPEFDPTDVNELLGQFLPELVPLLEPFLIAGAPRQSVQLIVGCLLEVDTDDRLAGLVFDVLVSGVDPEPILGLLDGGIDAGLVTVLLPVLELLIAQDRTRSSVVLGLSTLLRPDVAVRVIPDLIVLAEKGAIAEVLQLLVILTGDSCG